MTTNTAPRPPMSPQAGPELRLTLTPDAPWSRLAGAWWPRSRDLSAELPALIADADRTWGRITRASVHGPAWSSLRHDQPTGSHSVHVSWFDATQDPHAISLFSYRIGCWELLVVPPGTAPWRASRLMAAASRPGNHQSAASLLTDGPAPLDAPQGRIRIRTRRARGRAPLGVS
jgi:hypothetical protein